MIVCKFGGTCSACPSAIKNISSLAKNANRRVLVFSAVGKENSNDEKLTDLLIEYCENEHSREDTHIKIISKLAKLIEITKVSFDVERQFGIAASDFLKSGDEQKFISRGEEWTAQIMAQYLGLPFVSAEVFMFFKNGRIDFKKAQSHLKKAVAKFGRIVVPGFYGVEKKRVVLFSRGGSDVSGALVAKMLNANVYENWTDVDGIYQVNPSICKSQVISRLSYSDLALISSHDGKVVHPDCAQILNGSDIITHVRSVFNIQSLGTKISSHEKNSLPYICYKRSGNAAEIKICQNCNNYKTIRAKSQNLSKIITKAYKKL